MLKKLLILTLLTFTSLFALDARSEAEIAHLLTYVKQTECKYIRNGTAHNGEEASKHILAKYKHFKKDIKTTEDFIRLSATQSLMTGSKYYIECPGESKIPSGQWLLSELKRFRNK